VVDSTLAATTTTGPSPALPITATITASADATLYEATEESAQVANGGGEFIYAGVNGRGEIRRAVLRFDLSGIPATAQVGGFLDVVHGFGFYFGGLATLTAPLA
jgi:hypothetical protein